MTSPHDIRKEKTDHPNKAQQTFLSVGSALFYLQIISVLFRKFLSFVFYCAGSDGLGKNI